MTDTPTVSPTPTITDTPTVTPTPTITGTPTTTPTPTVTSTPTATPLCGNSIVEAGESCDPPGTLLPPNSNPCRDDCTFCGDGIVNGPPGRFDPGHETCDDQNSVELDDCRNTCRGRMKRDPATIRFRGPKQIHDRLKVTGRIDPGVSLDPSTLVVGVRLSNTSGVIFEAEASGILLVKNTLKYRNGGTVESPLGGIGDFQLAPHKGEYRAKIVAYGDLSAASAPDMTVEVFLGSGVYSGMGEWYPTSNGWRLVDHTR